MNKHEVLKELFQLPKDEILDIFEIINGYKTRVNKSKKDKLLMRCVFMRGYYSIKDFLKDYKQTKDTSFAKALDYETWDIKVYFKLKNILNIDDELFEKIIRELEQEEE